jgi:hypothetical protein
MLIFDRTSFKFKDYTIIIEQDKALVFKQYNNVIPFLYADKQVININDDSTMFELKFKYDVFSNNKLYIYGSYNNYAILDNCQNDTIEVKNYKTKFEDLFSTIVA